MAIDWQTYQALKLKFVVVKIYRSRVSLRSTIAPTIRIITGSATSAELQALRVAATIFTIYASTHSCAGSLRK
jgi:hypothetical protein